MVVYLLIGTMRKLGNSFLGWPKIRLVCKPSCHRINRLLPTLLEKQPSVMHKWLSNKLILGLCAKARMVVLDKRLLKVNASVGLLDRLAVQFKLKVVKKLLKMLGELNAIWI
jgi:hypothetical protein